MKSRTIYKILCYALAAACLANLLLMGISLIAEGRIVQYRVSDSSRLSTELYYTIIDRLDDALMLLVIIWFPFSLVMAMVASNLRMPISTRFGIAAFLVGMIILKVDPFGNWFYLTDWKPVITNRTFEICRANTGHPHYDFHASIVPPAPVVITCLRNLCQVVGDYGQEASSLPPFPFRLAGHPKYYRYIPG